MNKKLVKLSSVLFPKKVANFAYKMLTNPQVKKLRTNEIVTLDRSIKEVIPFKGFDIQTYKWLGGEDSVLLIHGWEGQAGNFSDIIERLIIENYTIYAFDGPSHGYSSKGKTSLFEFTELVGELIKKYEVKKLISHSFGGVATTYALSINPDIIIDKYVLLTIPDKFSERIDDVANQVGISDKVKKKLINRLEIETEMNIEILNVSEFVREVNVKRALIIHDKNDKVIPIGRSRNVYDNWNECEFLEVTDTGHFRILRTKVVIDNIVQFLS